MSCLWGLGMYHNDTWTHWVCGSFVCGRSSYQGPSSRNATLRTARLSAHRFQHGSSTRPLGTGRNENTTPAQTSMSMVLSPTNLVADMFDRYNANCNIRRTRKAGAKHKTLVFSVDPIECLHNPAYSEGGLIPNGPESSSYLLPFGPVYVPYNRYLDLFPKGPSTQLEGIYPKP